MRKIKARYGVENIETTVFVDDESGAYVAKGGYLVNYTGDSFVDVSSINELRDYHCFTWREAINTLTEFRKALA